jgi:hypothetical protein
MTVCEVAIYLKVESVSLDKAFLGTAQLIATNWFGVEEQGVRSPQSRVRTARRPG